MTLDTLTALLALLGAVVVVLSGVGGLMAWGLRRIDRRFEHVDRRFEQVDAQFVDIRRELGEVKADVVDLKIAVARLEGPRPTLHPLH